MPAPVKHDPRSFFYGRASKATQVASPETQKMVCGKYVDFAQIPPITHWFTDPDSSGKLRLEDRPAGGQLLRSLRPGDHVITYNLDRMFRKAVDCLVVMEEFKRKGVKLHICNIMGGAAIDLSSPVGEFLIGMLAQVAQLERSYISQRTKDGLAARKARGEKHSRFPGYGFKWAEVKGPGGKKVRERVADNDERSVMRDIAAWRSQNRSSWQEIADHLAKLDVKTKDGQPWSSNRVRRVYAAQVKLMAAEAKKLET